MPKLRGEEVMRAGVHANLPQWLELQIDRQRTGPWCCICGNSIAQSILDLGYDTHPTCGPLDRPAPRSTD